MMRIEEYFKIVKFSFYGPLAPSVGVSGPSLNNLKKLHDLSYRNHKSHLKSTFSLKKKTHIQSVS